MSLTFSFQASKLNAWPNLSPRAQDVLKLTAILSMVADHANRSLNPWPLEFPGLLLAWFGRLAFPLFALLIAHHLAQCRATWQRYSYLLLIAGLSSQWPFHALTGTDNLNIMFTLLVGVLAIAASDALDARVFKGAGLFAVLLASFVGLNCDYPLFGFALIPLGVWLIRSSHPLMWLPFLAVAYLTNFLTGMPWVVLLVLPVVWAASSLEGHRFLRVPYLGYWFYPLHLLVILGLKSVVL